MSEKEFYSKDYWYDSPEEHADVDNYGEFSWEQIDVWRLICYAIILAMRDV